VGGAGEQGSRSRKNSYSRKAGTSTAHVYRGM